MIFPKKEIIERIDDIAWTFAGDDKRRPSLVDLMLGMYALGKLRGELVADKFVKEAEAPVSESKL